MKPYHGPTVTKHPGGRSMGEQLAGMTAVVNHAHRHETPFLLAQTKRAGPLKTNLRALIHTGSSLGVVGTVSAPRQQMDQVKYDGKLVSEMNEAELQKAILTAESRLNLAEINVARAVSGRKLMTPQEYKKLKRSADPLPDLQAEPNVAKVNAPTATESSVPKTSLARIRLGVSRAGLVMTAPPETAEDIGRLGRPLLSLDDEGRPMVSFMSDPTGYRWSSYKHDEMRITVTPNSLPAFPQGFPLFRLAECRVWEYDEKLNQLNVLMPKDLMDPKQFGPRKSDKRKPPQRTADGPMAKFGKQTGGIAKALEALPVEPVTLEEVTHPIMPEQAGVTPTDDEMRANIVNKLSPLTPEQLNDVRRGLAILNDVKRELGDTVRYSIDTVNGELHARIVAEINL